MKSKDYKDMRSIQRKINALQKEIKNKLSDITNYERIYDYSLNELLINSNNLVKYCERCGKPFITMRGRLSMNKYCSSNCCKDTSRERIKYNHKMDPLHRKIDLLRKTIYQRKYLARSFNKKKDLAKIEDYDSILNELNCVTSNLKSGKYNQRTATIKVSNLEKEYLHVVYK